MSDKRSYSELDTFGRCPIKFKFKYLDDLQSAKKNATLHEGTIQHKVNEAGLLLMRQYPDDMQWGIDGLIESMWREDGPLVALLQDGADLRFPAEQEEHAELIRTCVRRFERWLEHYDLLEDWQILHVEEEFEIELDNGLVITCTPDLVARHLLTGDVWVIDLKTMATIPDEMDPTLQTRINLTAVKAVYPETVGFMFDAMRKKEPREPELIKSGARISRLNQIDTDFRTMSDWIEENKPELFNDPDTQARLAELREQGQDKWFRRFKHYLSPEEMGRALEDVSREAATLELVQENELWYRVWQEDFGYKRCSRCEFYTLCVTDLRGGDVDRVIEQFYEPRDTSYKEYEEEDE